MKEIDECIEEVITEIEVEQWKSNLSFLQNRPPWGGSMMPNYYNYPWNKSTHPLTICSHENKPVPPPVIYYTVQTRSNNDTWGTIVPNTQEVKKGNTAYVSAKANPGYLIELWGGVTSSTGVGEQEGTAQLANVQRNSTITCTFKEDIPPIVKYKVYGITNNTAYGEVVPSVQEVEQGTMATVTATSKEGYVIDKWEGATLSTGEGTHTGFAELSNVQSTSTITCNFKVDTPIEDNKTVICFNSSITWDYINCLNINMSNVQLFNTKGEYTFQYKIQQNTKPGIAPVYYANDLEGAPYPFPIYERACFKYPDPGAVGQKAQVFFEAVDKNATYRVRLYCNTKNNAGMRYQDMRYVVNGVEQTPTFPTTDNVDKFLEWDNVQLDEELIKIETYATYQWVAVVYNVVEIYKN